MAKDGISKINTMCSVVNNGSGIWLKMESETCTQCVQSLMMEVVYD